MLQLLAKGLAASNLRHLIPKSEEVDISTLKVQRLAKVAVFIKFR